MASIRPGQNKSTRALHLGRRRFLKSLGVCVGVPAFQSLMPALLPTLLPRAALAAPKLATTHSGAPLRVAFMSIPNGVHQGHWFPKESSDAFLLNDTMRPLESVKQHLQVISGLKHEHATAGPDGAGDHARANATFLTGLRAHKTAGKDIHVGISVDQLAAQHLGHLTRFQSLELTCDAVRNSGSCDSGYACAYQYNISWSSPSTPVTPEPNPRLAFERLFGTEVSPSGSKGSGNKGYGNKGSRNNGSRNNDDPTKAAVRDKHFLQRLQNKQSVLDYVLADAQALSRQLDQHDRRKLDEYLTSVRSLEQQIERFERLGNSPAPEAEAPTGIPSDFGAHMDMMYDLLALAFQTDSTRIATLLLAYDGSNRSFPSLGISEGHHRLSHNMVNEKSAQHVAKIDRYYMERFARFLKKMAKTEDVDGKSLLDNSMIVYGGAIGDGNRHTHDNLPAILAGGGGGNLTTGRHLQLPEMPMSNLFLDMLSIQGIAVDRFGDSTGRIGLL